MLYNSGGWTKRGGTTIVGADYSYFTLSFEQKVFSVGAKNGSLRLVLVVSVGGFPELRRGARSCLTE